MNNRTVKYADPLHAGRHPFQTFLLALCVVSGVPLIFGGSVEAPSIEALLPNWVAFAWGCSLAGGAAIGLVGSYWPRNNYATALTVERVGLVVVGPAAVLYSFAIIVFVGVVGIVAALITLGFGAACIKRGHDIGKIIRRAIPDGDNAAPIRREHEDETETLYREGDQ